MPRRRRIQLPGLTHHVMARGNGRMCIFLDPSDYRHFLYLLGDTLEQFSIACWNYCLMPNHYHATLQPADANLSQAMQRLNSSYGIWWNKRHARVGHVFQGRFKNQVVEDHAYLLALSRYVVMNPVRARLTEEPMSWPWSSYRAMMGRNAWPPFLTTVPISQLFGGGDDAAAQARFARFVEDQPDEDELSHRLRSDERIVGDSAFKSKVRTLEREQDASVGAPPADDPADLECERT